MAVVVVSGLPRSGTSMMMQMLQAGGLPVLSDGVREADIDNPKGYWEFEPVKQTAHDAGWLAQADGSAVKMVFTLLGDLPAGNDYRIIFMRREMPEVLASQAAMLRRLDKPGARLAADRLGALFSQQLRKVQDWLATQPHMQVLEVGYRDTLTQPLAQARRVSEFLGGTLAADAMAAVVDPGLYRQRH